MLQLPLKRKRKKRTKREQELRADQKGNGYGERSTEET
ncbi:WSSV518 [White spot syndrome virus]|uniref:WSSV518 n=1 Tax=White spot syndrome virus TaxID=342409 RepID=A0A2I6SCH1_9VIRU|nr:WSSV518 [White spot syndrome virus]